MNKFKEFEKFVLNLETLNISENDLVFNDMLDYSLYSGYFHLYNQGLNMYRIPLNVKIKCVYFNYLELNYNNISKQ